jgi:hypothetical protein
MKTKYLLLVMGGLLAAGGLWFGRAAWRAHRQLVTLDVRNVPLADVLRKLEGPTKFAYASTLRKAAGQVSV